MPRIANSSFNVIEYTKCFQEDLQDVQTGRLQTNNPKAQYQDYATDVDKLCHGRASPWIERRAKNLEGLDDVDGGERSLL